MTDDKNEVHYTGYRRQFLTYGTSINMKGSEMLNQEDTTKEEHWSLKNVELQRFYLCIGEYVFQLQLAPGSYILNLILIEQNQLEFGKPIKVCVASTGPNFKWDAHCKFKYLSAVAAAVTTAETFVRQLIEKQPKTVEYEKPGLPEGASWCTRYGEEAVSFSGGFLTVPDHLMAKVYKALLERYRQTKLQDELRKTNQPHSCGDCANHVLESKVGGRCSITSEHTLNQEGSNCTEFRAR